MSKIIIIFFKFEEKKLWVKKNWQKDILVKKIFGSKKFVYQKKFVTKIFCVKKNWVRKTIGSKKI